MQKIITKMLIAVFLTGAALAIWFLLLGMWNETTYKIFLSTLILFSAGVPGIACCELYDKNKYRNVAIAGMLIIAIGALYFLLLLWGALDFNIFDAFKWKLMFTFMIFSFSSAHISILLLLSSEKEKVILFRNGTIIFSLIFDVIFILAIFFDVEFNGTLVAIVLILIAAGSLVAPLMSRLDKDDERVVEKQNNKYAELAQIKELLDNGAITQAEYDLEKQRILNK